MGGFHQWEYLKVGILTPFNHYFKSFSFKLQ